LLQTSESGGIECKYLHILCVVCVITMSHCILLYWYVLYVFVLLYCVVYVLLYCVYFLLCYVRIIVCLRFIVLCCTTV
jgi:hypothetical protein